jgi:hypothetical protein
MVKTEFSQLILKRCRQEEQRTRRSQDVNIELSERHSILRRGDSDEEARLEPQENIPDNLTSDVYQEFQDLIRSDSEMVEDFYHQQVSKIEERFYSLAQQLVQLVRFPFSAIALCACVRSVRTCFLTIEGSDQFVRAACRV